MRLLRHALGAFLLVAPALPLAAQGRSVLPESWRLRDEAPVATGRRAMVVSSSPIASEVGRDVLRAGGNAVDAAVAVGFALAVVHPVAGNIGGGGFMVMRMHNGRTYALDYRETAPAAATRDMYLDENGDVSDKSRIGHLASGVPGAVAGMLAAHERFGRLPRAAVIEPAIRLARDGFILDDHRARSLRGAARQLARFDGSARQFLINGTEGPPDGYLLRQPDLARTLTAIRDLGKDGFYRGWVADSLEAEMRRGGGIMTRADLAAYEARWREPIRINYRGWTIWSMPPASSGGATLAMILNILEAYDPLPAWGTPQLMHLEAEAMRRAFTDRNRFLGDPDFEDVPLARLVSKEHAAELRADIDLDRATPTPPFDPSIVEGNNTTHYSVVDAEGNAVSTTTTINFGYGSYVTVRGAGFLLNNEMDDFASAPGRPNGFGLVQGEVNAIEPGKRMLSAMTPSIVLDSAGALRMVVGSPGGPTIITQVFHVISNVIDHHMSLADAVSAPRTHHQALPDRLRVEGPGGFAESVLAALRGLGHQIDEGGTWGDFQAIMRSGGRWVGVSDPRAGGGGSGY
ncbi:MAG TPA: gamma-glutamyltransferase [Gemmatimonadales bacterium]|nr:gamma-glutamyltransferase [Gemmatimonadales bacterium]